VTDKDGRYVLRFGPGMAFVRNDRRSTGIQAATISAHKPGYFEKNLGRQGNLAMADEPPAGADIEGYAGVVLPGQPKELDFVLVQAVKASGVLIDENGKPLSEYRMSLTGAELPPSSSALASGGKTDQNGRFEFHDIPTGYRFQILIEPPKA